MLDTYFSALRSVMTSASAIAWFERPSATQLEHLPLAVSERAQRLLGGA